MDIKSCLCVMLNLFQHLNIDDTLKPRLPIEQRAGSSWLPRPGWLDVDITLWF